MFLFVFVFSIFSNLRDKAKELQFIYIFLNLSQQLSIVYLYFGILYNY